MDFNSSTEHSLILLLLVHPLQSHLTLIQTTQWSSGSKRRTGNFSAGTIGAALTGNFGNVTGNVDGIVGGTTPAAVTGTTITANTKFVGNLEGNADTATALANSRTLALSGDATGSASFDGSCATISATLADSGVSAGTYGGAAAVPVLTVDSKGRVTSATTTAVGSGLTVVGDSGSEDINLLSESLTISGGTNLSSNAASNGVTVNLNDDISIVTAAVSGVVTASGGFVGNITGNIHCTLRSNKVGSSYNTGQIYMSTSNCSRNIEGIKSSNRCQ